MDGEFGIILNGVDAQALQLPGTPADPDNQRAYIDLRGCIGSQEEMAACLNQISNATGVKEGVIVVSLGDEITISGGNTSDAAFADWCKAEGANATVGCGGAVNTSLLVATGIVSGNGNYYWSNKFVNTQGTSRYRALTQQIKAVLPNANVGANYPPQMYFQDPRDQQQYCHSYLGTAFQYIDFFRGGGMTLPWSEDWTWQAPVASQQVIGLLVDTLRAGVTVYDDFGDAPYGYKPHSTQNTTHPQGNRQEQQPVVTQAAHQQVMRPYRARPKPYEIAGGAPAGGATPILMYAMAHSPSNHPINWRRNAFTHIAHGVKMLDLFEFQTSISGYTCDYVDQDTHMYEMVRHSLQEIAQFDDIVFGGVAQAAGAKVALLYSMAADLFLSPFGTQGTAKRTLYLALKHSEFPVDIVTEMDCTKGHLNHYGVLYVVDAQVSEATVHAMDKWAQAGGRVVLTAGAAMLNEYNLTNTATAGSDGTSLLGTLVTPKGVYTGTRAPCNATIYFAKQDLPYAEELDTVTVGAGAGPGVGQASPSTTGMPWGATFGIYGEKAIFAVNKSASTDASAKTVATFASDGSPAALNITKGAGSILLLAFHPGLSYMYPALPKRPVDRTPVMTGLTNLVPTKMDGAVRQLLASAATAVPMAAPLQSSNSLVEASLITRQGDPRVLDSWNGSVVVLVDWSTTGGGAPDASRNDDGLKEQQRPHQLQHLGRQQKALSYTRVNISIAALPRTAIPYATATLASCNAPISATGCRRVLPPFSPGNPTNVTALGVSRFNISADGLSFSADVLVSDAIVLRPSAASSER